MGSAQKRSAKQSPVKVVFRRGKHFICGMCRKSYSSQDSAKGCLKNCIDHMVQTRPLSFIRKSGTIVAKCNLCSRTYKDQREAEACVKDCLSAVHRNRAMDEHVTGIPLEAPKEIVFEKPKMVAVPIQQVPRIKVSRQEAPPEVAVAEPAKAAAEAPEEIEEMTGDMGTVSAEKKDEAAPAADPDPTPSAEAAKEAPKTPEVEPGESKRRTTDVKEPFYREDAKYVCAVCIEKYFTKVEVEACFKKHQEEEAQEGALAAVENAG